MSFHFPAAYPADFPADPDRRAIALQIEALIALLDTMDGDCELEEDNEDACLAMDDSGTGDHLHARQGDTYAGDPDDAEDDLEDCCTAADDGCGYAQLGGHAGWGSIHDELCSTLPTYGLDQSVGPINEALATREWQHQQRHRSN